MGDSVADRPTGGGGRPDRRRHSAGSSVLTPPTGVPAVPAQRKPRPAPASRKPEAPPVAPPAPPVQPTVVEPCACGHAREAHEHYRPGTDCGVCGATACSAYRARGGSVSGMLRRLGLID
jgi:hypothetical protein